MKISKSVYEGPELEAMLAGFKESEKLGLGLGVPMPGFEKYAAPAPVPVAEAVPAPVAEAALPVKKGPGRPRKPRAKANPEAPVAAPSPEAPAPVAPAAAEPSRLTIVDGRVTGLDDVLQLPPEDVASASKMLREVMEAHTDAVLIKLWERAYEKPLPKFEKAKVISDVIAALTDPARVFTIEDPVEIKADPNLKGQLVTVEEPDF